MEDYQCKVSKLVSEAKIKKQLYWKISAT